MAFDPNSALTRTNYRWFLALSVATGLASGIFGDTGSSPALIAAHAQEPMPLFIEAHPLLTALVGVIIGILTITGTVGLYRFKQWGPTVALWATIAAFAVYPIYGSTLLSPLGSFILSIAEMSWGAVLALAFLSPLRKEFQNRSLSDVEVRELSRDSGNAADS
jgi:hypothetical protein